MKQLIKNKLRALITWLFAEEIVRNLQIHTDLTKLITDLTKLIDENYKKLDNVKTRLDVINTRMAAKDIAIKDLRHLQTQIVEIQSIADRKHKVLTKVLGDMHVSMDVNEPRHHKSCNSWAVISIEGEAYDYIRFMPFGTSELRVLQDFLKNFNRYNVDAGPHNAYAKGEKERQIIF